MEKKPPLVLTPFDQYVTNDSLQMIKVLIPYLPADLQRMAGIYVKMTEFITVMSKPGFHTKPLSSMDCLFQEMKPYLSSESRQIFSEFSQFFEIFEMMQNIDINDIMQSMDFADISNMFQTERNDDHERMDESSRTEES